MQFGENEEQSLLDSSGTSKARMHNRDSELEDMSCGEPLLAQRLLIDFTPREELDIDSEYNQKKCRAFWDFIKSKPELQHLMAVPEALDYGESVTSSGSRQSKASAEAPELVERTAVSMLELVQTKGQMDPVFVGLAPHSHCSLGSREYPDSLITTKKVQKRPHVSVCACKGSCDLCRRRSKERSRAHVANAAMAVDLCQKIDKWDAEHPKSMAPPGHPPNLCSARRKL